MRRPSIFEIATAFEDGKNGEIKPRTNVVVNSTREWYGKNSTVSTFTATAYLKKNELFNFFNQYGKQGIKINIGFK